jgi:hypothetical protein
MRLPTVLAIGTTLCVSAVSPASFGTSFTAPLHGYSLDLSTGVLTPLAGSPFVADVFPNAVSDLTILQ